MPGDRPIDGLSDGDEFGELSDLPTGESDDEPVQAMPGVTVRPTDPVADEIPDTLVERVTGQDCAVVQLCADLQARTQALNEECCNEPGEDCSSGRPATCNLGCAHVLLPFFDDCSGALGEEEHPIN